MSGAVKKPCIKCLLSDLDESEILGQIKKLILLMPKSEKCRETEYKRRLDICRECASLSFGTCEVCGCYAELRAIKRDNRCPHEKHFW